MTMTKKRMLDIRPKEFDTYEGPDIINAIKAAEGRSLASEIIAPAPAIFHDVSNGELAAAFGADMLLFNMYDVNAPSLYGYPYEGDALLKDIRRNVGRFVGINLEPVSHEKLMDEKTDVPKGRIGTPENARKAYEQGAQFILLTGNPKTGVTNKEIVASLKGIREKLGDKIVLAAGKMHSAGIGGETARNIINEKDINDFISAGADIILIPAPGTVPGFSDSYAETLVEAAHKRGVLVMSAIGTSQEGSDSDTIKAIALSAKRIGVDLHHIGDAGYFGIAVPENIRDYSIVIKGIRHTYRRIAMK